MSLSPPLSLSLSLQTVPRWLQCNGDDIIVPWGQGWPGCPCHRIAAPRQRQTLVGWDGMGTSPCAITGHPRAARMPCLGSGQGRALPPGPRVPRHRVTLSGLRPGFSLVVNLSLCLRFPC